VKCIIGLGNPGNRYRFTRHNIGFLAAEALIEKVNAKHSESNQLYESYLWSVGENQVLVVMPQTYMNNSGFAARELHQRYQLSYDDFLIMSDDFQLPFGTLRMRAKGSDGGHNGLASVIYHLQSELVPRLRFGVADKAIPENHSHDNMADYVLTRFDAEEEKFLPQLFQFSIEAIQSWVTDGIAKTMSLYNKNFYNPAS
jgi:PTH1 family peptidyl-tRNA hydrolase